MDIYSVKVTRELCRSFRRMARPVLYDNIEKYRKGQAEMTSAGRDLQYALKIQDPSIQPVVDTLRGRYKQAKETCACACSVLEKASQGFLIVERDNVIRDINPWSDQGYRKKRKNALKRKRYTSDDSLELTLLLIAAGEEWQWPFRDPVRDEKR